MADTTKPSAFATVKTFVDNGESQDKQEFDITQCKVETVVVYLDRAEVCRVLKAKLETGENEVRLTNLTKCIDKESVRVEGRGSATITEVAFQTKELTPDEESNEHQKEKQLRKQLEDAERRHGSMRTKQHRLRKQRDVLDGFADNVKQPGSSGNNEKGAVLLDDSVLKGMVGFFDLYERQATRLDDALHDLQQQQQRLQAEITALTNNLQQIASTHTRAEARELLVLLDATEPVDVELYVSYVVSKAKWSPKYDIRVFSSDNNMKIQYYGIVQQATGEDWGDTKLCLSTAMPSVGGTVPDLGTQRLSFKPKFVRSPKSMGFLSVAANRAGSFRMKKKAAAPEAMMMRTEEGDIYEDSESLPEMEHATAEVKESITSTMYEIARRSSIPCDNQGHKVSVAIVDLKPSFEYECVPKRTSHAYLKAKVKNTSPYALLAGPTNIFLDNNFIAKAELKAVSPSEDFTCSLGVDPGVRVVYKPVYKYREQSGLLTKSVVTTYKQVIEIKNTHPDAIKILVMDQLPLSSEEKIKVALQEPVIKHPEKYDKTKAIRLNKLNNVEWELEIGTNETRELTLKYTVEHPLSEEVDSTVVHISTNTGSTSCEV